VYTEEPSKIMENELQQKKQLEIIHSLFQVDQKPTSTPTETRKFESETIMMKI